MSAGLAGGPSGGAVPGRVRMLKLAAAGQDLRDSLHTLPFPHPGCRGAVWAERKGNSFFNPQEIQLPFRHVISLEVRPRMGNEGLNKDPPPWHVISRTGQAPVCAEPYTLPSPIHPLSFLLACCQRYSPNVTLIAEREGPFRPVEYFKYTATGPQVGAGSPSGPSPRPWLPPFLTGPKHADSHSL